MFEFVFSIESLVSAISLATPILLGGLAAAICLKAGIVNIGIEGCMLIGAFCGITAGYYLDNPYLGLLAAVLSGVIFSLIFGFVHIKLGSDPIITGLALNLFADALTQWLLISAIDTPGSFYPTNYQGIPAINSAFFERLPFLAELLRGRTILDYSAWILTILLYIFMKRSIMSLHMRAVGEYSDAARSAGINVTWIKFFTLIICGALCGLAGADISITDLKMFTPGMTAGRGFISFTAAIFGSGNIVPTAVMSLLFSLFLSMAIRLEGFSLPTHFLQMIPYVMTIIILLFSTRGSKNSKLDKYTSSKKQKDLINQ